MVDRTADTARWRLRSGSDLDEATRRRRVQAVVGRLLEVVRAEGLEAIPLDARHLVAQPMGYRMRLDRYEGLPARLDWSFRLVVGTATVVSLVVRPGGPVRRCFVGPGSQWVIEPLLHRLVELLDGDELELDYALAGVEPIFPASTFLFPDGWWDTWKSRRLEDEGGREVGAIYRQELYPWVVRALRWPMSDRPPGEVRVVDLCGGDGEALSLVLDALPADLVPRAHLLDRNGAAVARAEARLGDRARCHRADLTDPEVLAGLQARVGGPADVVLAVGALQVNVMTPADAGALATAVAGLLAPGGVAVVAGWTPSLLTRADWEDRGLVVWNTVRPAAPGVWVGQQVYGLYRPS